MTSTDLAVRTDGQQLQVLTNDQLTYIAGTEFVPPGLRGNLPAILACVATGRALGIADMTALRSIHIIDGKATFSAELMVMLARQRGHSIQGEVSEGSATVTGKRADNGDTMTVTWTLAMADRAGLVNKSNWKKYPEAMLWARAVSQLCRELFADCFAGATYTPEELGADDTGPQGAPPPYDAAEDVPFGDDPTPYLPPTSSAGDPETKGPTPPEGTDGVPVTADPADDPLAKRKKKLDVIVKGKLKPPLRKVWTTVAKMRGVTTDALITDLGGIEEDGDLHWTPLRDAMTAGEMDALIGKLEKLSPFQPPAGVQAQLEGRP